MADYLKPGIYWKEIDIGSDIKPRFYKDFTNSYIEETNPYFNIDDDIEYKLHHYIENIIDFLTRKSRNYRPSRFNNYITIDNYLRETINSYFNGRCEYKIQQDYSSQVTRIDIYYRIDDTDKVFSYSIPDFILYETYNFSNDYDYEYEKELKKPKFKVNLPDELFQM